MPPAGGPSIAAVNARLQIGSGGLEYLRIPLGGRQKYLLLPAGPELCSVVCLLVAPNPCVRSCIGSAG